MKDKKKNVYCPLCFQPMTHRPESNKYDCMREHGQLKQTVWVEIKDEN